ncbi:hypothetical protein ABZ863_18885 [Saccharomonospora sp. NPDC046836]|uniref:hypothetical protein n=1 Tax=Saccharomonospora sp. NPDC046836 TaxID=3156921 RepID=UPI0033C257B5
MAKWNLGIGAGLLVVAVVCSILDLIPVAVIAGILGLIGLVIAGYDVIYNWLDRAQLRRRAARASRENKGRQGH